VNLAFTTIVSPIDGVVVARSVDVGQTVAASLQAPTLFIIAEDLRKMQVDTSVAEADVGKLEPGMDASFVVDAFPSERFRGKVRQIRNAPQTVQNVVTYNAVIDVSNSELKLKPGMTANVTFTYGEREDVLRVPNTALRFRPDPALLAQLPGQGRRRGGADGASRAGGRGSPQGRRTVWVLREGAPKAVLVETGLSDGVVTEIVTGELSEGDELVTDIVSSRPAAQTRPGGGGGGGGMRRFF
jgi:HlyD family secretion protein